MALLLDSLVVHLERQIYLGEKRARISPKVLEEFFKDFPSLTSDTKSSEIEQKSPAGIGHVAEPTKTVLLQPENTTIVPQSSQLTFSRQATVNDIEALSLAQLREYGNSCSACNFSLGEKRSIEVGLSEKPRLMVISEPCGRSEEQMLDPFSGEAGQLFYKMLQAMKLDFKQIYIAMAHKCFGPSAREKIVESRPYLERQIQLLKPEVILVFGGAALTILLGEQSLMNVRGRWLNFQGVPLMATYPAIYLLQKNEAKKEAWKDMQQVMAKLSI